MKKAWIILIVSISVFLFSGCASKPALRKEMFQEGQLRIVTQCVPKVGVKVYHSGGELAAIVSSTSGIGLGLPGLIADTSVKKWERAVEREIFAANVPRFCELVMQGVVEKIGGEIPNWQPVIIDDQGVDPGTVKSLLRKGPLFVLASGSSFSVPQYSCAPGLSTAHGLESKYLARLYVGGDLIWEKEIEYASDHENRYRKIEAFAENNWEYLKQEMAYAANLIASRLVEGLMIEIRRAD